MSVSYVLQIASLSLRVNNLEPVPYKVKLLLIPNNTNVCSLLASINSLYNSLFDTGREKVSSRKYRLKNKLGLGDKIKSTDEGQEFLSLREQILNLSGTDRTKLLSSLLDWNSTLPSEFPRYYKEVRNLSMVNFEEDNVENWKQQLDDELLVNSDKELANFIKSNYVTDKGVFDYSKFLCEGGKIDLLQNLVSGERDFLSTPLTYLPDSLMRDMGGYLGIPEHPIYEPWLQKQLQKHWKKAAAISAVLPGLYLGREHLTEIINLALSTYQRLDELGYAGIFLSAASGEFMQVLATVQFMMPDFLNSGYSPYGIMLTAAAGGIVGAWSVFELARRRPNFLAKYISKIGSQSWWADFIKRHEMLGLGIMVALPVPTPVDALYMLSGFSNMDRKRFLIAVTIGMLIRQSISVAAICYGLDNIEAIKGALSFLPWPAPVGKSLNFEYVPLDLGAKVVIGPYNIPKYQYEEMIKGRNEENTKTEFEAAKKRYKAENTSQLVENKNVIKNINDKILGNNDNDNDKSNIFKKKLADGQDSSFSDTLTLPSGTDKEIAGKLIRKLLLEKGVWNNKKSLAKITFNNYFSEDPGEIEIEYRSREEFNNVIRNYAINKLGLKSGSEELENFVKYNSERNAYFYNGTIVFNGGKDLTFFDIVGDGLHEIGHSFNIGYIPFMWGSTLRESVLPEGIAEDFAQNALENLLNDKNKKYENCGFDLLLPIRRSIELLPGQDLRLVLGRAWVGRERRAGRSLVIPGQDISEGTSPEELILELSRKTTELNIAFLNNKLSEETAAMPEGVGERALPAPLRFVPGTGVNINHIYTPRFEGNNVFIGPYGLSRASFDKIRGGLNHEEIKEYCQKISLKYSKIQHSFPAQDL